MKLTIENMSSCGEANGIVAYLRMPLALGAMSFMNKFVEKAYGKDCLCSEEPEGWLQIIKPEQGLSV